MFHIIDDNQNLCELTAEIIKSAGYQARCFTDPVLYLSQLERDDFVAPKAIFTDMRMPGMDGMELIQRAKAVLPDQKIVIISGYADEDGNLSDDVCHFLNKPCPPENLIEIVKAIDFCDNEGPSARAREVCLTQVDSTMQADFHCPLACKSCLN